MSGVFPTWGIWEIPDICRITTTKEQTRMEQSAIARLLQQIDLEYSAARAALNEPALGFARHDFISARMERMALCHEELSIHVGDQEASRLLIERMEAPE